MGLRTLFQRAGANSTQTSVQTMNVYNGITEQRAREICKEEYAVIARDMTREASEIAAERVGQLAEKLLPKMVEYDAQLKAFADPSYQLAIRKAQMSAACTDEESDYEMLSELLLERAKVNNDKSKQLGITKALEIVGQVSDDALFGLSVWYIAVNFKPLADDLHQALDVFNQIFVKIIGDKTLPKGERWMEELDILTAIRLNHLGIKKSKIFLSEIYADQLVSGVRKDSPDYERIKKDLLAVDLPAASILVPHPLKPNYVKLCSNKEVEEMLLEHDDGGRIYTTELTKEQKEVIQRVATELRRDESKILERQDAFMREWDKYPYLKRLREWWDAMRDAPFITPVGEALANAYTRMIDPSIPKLY